jgi:hypothetical protein
MMPALAFSILSGFYVCQELLSKGHAPVKAKVTMRWIGRHRKQGHAPRCRLSGYAGCGRPSPLTKS